MRLKALAVTILTLSLQLCHIIAFPPNPQNLMAPTNHDEEGYECGNVFFSDSEVKKAVSLGLKFIDLGYHHPQRYQGKLYMESKFTEYFIWPIRKKLQPKPQTKDPRTVFRVVFTRDSNEAVDVIAKVTTGDYTKCIPRYGSHIESSHSVQEILDGYLCGYEFFTDETVYQSLVLAQTRNEGNSHYPSLYVGNIYPENSGYLMWPIIKDKSDLRRSESFFLILSKERQFVDVVVKGHSKNYLRCIRSRQPPSAAPASDPYSELFVQPPRTGYICGKSFFSDKVLEDNALIAEQKAKNAKGSKFPEIYRGPPFNRHCLVWPILRDGSLYNKGKVGNFRMILTPDYQVLKVAIFYRDKIKICDRKTIVAKKNHDTSDYLCNKQKFTRQQLIIAAEKACGKMNTASKYLFPARYHGPRFASDGPYYTYPAYPNGDNRQRGIGLYRVVINVNCEVVGALTALRINNDGILHDSLPKRLVKCHRLEDGTSPFGFIHPNGEIIYESKIKYN